MRRKPTAPHEFLGKQFRVPSLTIGNDYSRAWNRYLVRLGLRLILDSQRQAEAAGTPFQRPTAEALIECFDEIVWDKAVINGGYDDIRHRGALRYSQIDRLTSSAAEFVLVHYDTTKLSTWAAWGRKSSRALSITAGQVSRLSHLSKAAQAKVLGCSTAHIAKLRRIVNMRKKALEVKQQREPISSPPSKHCSLHSTRTHSDRWALQRDLSVPNAPPRIQLFPRFTTQARDAARTTTDLSTFASRSEAIADNLKSAPGNRLIPAARIKDPGQSFTATSPSVALDTRSSLSTTSRHST